MPGGESVCQTDRRGRDETVCEGPMNRGEKKTEVDGYPEWGEREQRLMEGGTSRETEGDE